MKSYPMRQIMTFVNSGTLPISSDKTLRLQLALPVDSKQMEIIPSQVQTYFTTFFQRVEAVPALFIFNMDEMGHQ
jgi:hypothetical protein